MKLFALLIAALLALPAQAQTIVRPGGAIYDSATGSFLGFLNLSTGREERIGMGSPLILQDGTAAAPSLQWANGTAGYGLFREPVSGGVVFSAATAPRAGWFSVSSGGASAVADNGTSTAAGYYWNDSASWGTVVRGALLRDGTDYIYAFRVGTNPQTLRLYSTYTDASNYERLAVSATGGTTSIGTEQAGTGTSRPLGITVGGTSVWQFNTSGNLIPVTNDARDIGTAATNRVRNIYTSKVEYTGFTFANIGTTMTTNGDVGYCSDCTIANPCASGGTGAIAKRLNSVNVCN